MAIGFEPYFAFKPELTATTLVSPLAFLGALAAPDSKSMCLNIAVAAFLAALVAVEETK